MRQIKLNFSRLMPGKLFLAIPLVSALYGCGAGNGEGLDTNGEPVDNNQPVLEGAFAKVQEIFNQNCTSCHSGAQAQGSMNLAEGVSYDQIVNQPSVGKPELNRIEPSSPDTSYLIQKIRGDDGIVGVRMPANGLFLSDEEVQVIIDWVADGAPPPVQADPNAEFEANLNHFVNYQNWEVVDYSITPTNGTILGEAHEGVKETFSRRVFANNKALEQKESGGDFANGSILVKEIVTYENGSKEFSSPMGLLAMVKRGGDFNSDHNGWEWVVLSSDLSAIDARAGNLMDNGCNNCHIAAGTNGEAGKFGGVDYVFDHQSEYVASIGDFQDYKEWDQIDLRSDLNSGLGDMAHGAGDSEPEMTVRRVYKKQLYANPSSVDRGYPIGTMLLKEVTKEDQVIEITAMVKRGGEFNSNNGNWEWFMIDPATMQFVMNGNEEARGANLMNGMCNGCHSRANTVTQEGIDYVFKHGGDPFNNNSEFVAELSDFSNYKSWEVVDYTIGPVNGAIGGGHQGQDDDYARRVYANQEAKEFEGTTYKKGSILVKEIFTWQGDQEEFSPSLGLVAMVKRGGTFNSANSGWEWFELENDVSGIIGRGGDYRNNGCNSCHQSAPNDLAFAHPTEFVADDRHFENYDGSEWELIDERSDSSQLIADAHQAGDADAVRRIYKKQPLARPIDGWDFGYPIGTTFVKEVTKNNQIIEITAMVKRGGSFSNTNGNWEWFMLDPTDGTILEDDQNNLMRGADLMGGMCGSCHTTANRDDVQGEDFVFFHPNDPIHSTQ